MGLKNAKNSMLPVFLPRFFEFLLVENVEKFKFGCLFTKKNRDHEISCEMDDTMLMLDTVFLCRIRRHRHHALEHRDRQEDQGLCRTHRGRGRPQPQAPRQQGVKSLWILADLFGTTIKKCPVFPGS